MDNKDKELAVKIFDYFFKKAGISAIKTFSLKDSFLLDVCDAEGNWHTVYDKDSHNFMQFSVPKGQCSIVSSCNVITMKLDDVPKEIKEAVVNGCINGNACINESALSIVFSRHFKTLLPVAKSLEELMICIDLSS